MPHMYYSICHLIFAKLSLDKPSNQCNSLPFLCVLLVNCIKAKPSVMYFVVIFMFFCFEPKVKTKNILTYCLSE